MCSFINFDEKLSPIDNTSFLKFEIYKKLHVNSCEIDLPYFYLSVQIKEIMTLPFAFTNLLCVESVNTVKIWGFLKKGTDGRM